MEKFDTVIIGAGPAGLSAAKVLGEGGKKVAIFEKNKEIGPKVCAGGITHKVFEVGIPDFLIERKFYSMKVHLWGKSVEMKRERVFVATIERKALGQWMKEQLPRNVKIENGQEVVDIRDNFIILGNGRRVGFDCLIGADGSLSLTRRKLQVPTKKILSAIQYIIPKRLASPEIFLEPDLFGFGYAWIFPHKDYTSVGCGANLNSHKTENLKERFYSWLTENNIDVSNAKLESFPINVDYRGFQFGNKFLVGDAGGLAWSFNGEGIYFAIISGQEVARKILDPDYRLPKLKRVLRKKILGEKSERILLFLKSEALTKFIIKKFI